MGDQGNSGMNRARSGVEHLKELLSFNQNDYRYLDTTLSEPDEGSATPGVYIVDLIQVKRLTVTSDRKA